VSTWTDPAGKVWTVGELAAATTMNTYVRDNENATMHRYLTKPSDESSSSTTLHNDLHLSFAVAANDVWMAYYVLRWTEAGGGTDLKVAFTGPTSYDPTLNCAVRGDGSATQHAQWVQGTTFQTLYTVTSSSDGNYAVISGFFRISSTAGTVALQWAPDLANPLIMKAGSSLVAQRMSP